MFFTIYLLPGRTRHIAWFECHRPRFHDHKSHWELQAQSHLENTQKVEEFIRIIDFSATKALWLITHINEDAIDRTSTPKENMTWHEHKSASPNSLSSKLTSPFLWLGDPLNIILVGFTQDGFSVRCGIAHYSGCNNLPSQFQRYKGLSNSTQAITLTWATLLQRHKIIRIPNHIRLETPTKH